MSKYLEIFVNSYTGYAKYLWKEIVDPSTHSYFYWLIIVSLVFFGLELVAPWRKGQKKFRKDFWLDVFYMFFNFFLFSLIIYNAASQVVVTFINDTVLTISGIDLSAINPMYSWPLWAVLLVGFFVRDFVQWWIHRLLHRVDFLWEFHKVHHSVEQMGFAAHLRYHWMENIVYRSLEYLPLALIGVGLHEFFIIHIFTLAVGHYNHSNFSVTGRVTGAVVGGLIGIAIAFGVADIAVFSNPSIIVILTCIASATLLGSVVLGPVMKYIFNSPEMHIWHHSYDLPQEHKYGVNFALTLSLWDYLFGTDYIPYDGRDIRLGFPGIEDFPDDFIGQAMHGVNSKNK